MSTAGTQLGTPQLETRRTWLGNVPFVTRKIGDRRAAVHGLATAIAAFGGFAVGYWGLGRLDIAVFATFGGLALIGIADFQGSRQARVAATIGGALTGAVLATAGTWASSSAIWAGAIITALAGCATVYAGLLGAYLAAGTNAVILYYLVALGTPAGWGAVPGRLAGVALGGALAAVVSAVLGTEPAGPRLPARLAAESRRIAGTLRQVSAGAAGTADRPGDPIGSPIRLQVDSSQFRPAAPTAKGRSLLYLVNDLERLDRLTARIRHTALSQAERAQLDEPARDLDHVAAALEGQPVRGQQSPAPLKRVDLAARIRYAAALAGTHAAAAAGARTHRLADAPGLLSAARHAIRRIRAHATPDSVQLRSAVQTGAALAVACVAARTINVQHGFWVDLAALTVISSTARSTGRKMTSAITGTLIGCAIAIGLIVAIGSGPADYAVITPLAIAIAIWAREAIGFAAGQAGFTVAVLMLFSLLRPAGWHIELFRFEDVAIGVAVAVAVSAVAWPGGARSALRADLAQLRTAAASYLKAVTENLAGLGHTDGELDRARRQATAASIRAEAALSSLLSERPRPDETQLWSGAMSDANRIWYVADVLRNASGVIASPAAVSAAANLEAAAGAAPPIVPAGPSRPSPSKPDPDPLADWIRDL
jgi:hypothetical protein